MKIIHFVFIFLLWLPLHPLKSQWVKIAGPYGGWISSFAVNDTNIFTATDSAGIFRMNGDGSTWKSIDSGLTDMHVTCLTVSGKKIYAGTSGGRIFISSDNGERWKETNYYVLYNTIHPVISLAVSGPFIYAGSVNRGIFVSTDSGSNWNNKVNGIMYNPLVGDDISSVAINETYIFASVYGNGIYRSSDNGDTWKPIGSYSMTGWVWALSVFGKNIFAGTQGNGLFLSTNNGDSWTDVSQGLTNKYVNTFTSSGNLFFAGTDDGGIFLSNNNGKNWIAINAGLSNANVYALEVHGNYLFAGTEGGVFWRRLISDVTSTSDNHYKQTSTVFTLLQNYPNPFNPATNLEFTVANTGRATLKIINVIGQEVATLFDGIAEAGKYHQTTFNASKFASGIYFARLQSGDKVQLKKMVLMK